MSVQQLREEYTLAGLSEEELNPDPIRQFGLWMEQAVASGVAEPNAMTLATATPEGRPSARMVLLKEFDERGFVFYTNYSSVKAEQLAANPFAALVFYWSELERQVRIEGEVTKVAKEESAAYFRVRPRASQIGAHASPQSARIANRSWLEDRFRQLSDAFEGSEVPLPEDWGGYRVRPEVVEFWQGRPSRLHDRLAYRRTENRWRIDRLSP
jgi:pyridoxamine 5'-phosphate oxidase